MKLTLAGVVLLGATAVAAGQEVKVDEVARLAKAGNAFGFDMYGRLREAPGNLVISPASLQAALVMTWAGARGETAEEMGRVLHLEGDPAAVLSASGRMAAVLQDPARPVVLRLANRLFGERTAPLERAFLEAAKAAFGSALEPVDFKKAPEEARLLINGWVEKQTEKRIRDLVPPGAVKPATRLVLVNALYFLGDWEEPFMKEATRPAPFHLSPTERKDAPTMHRTEVLPFAQGKGFKAVALRYQGRQLSMLFVVPDALDGLPAVETSLTADGLEAIASSLAPTRVVLALPKFEIDPPGSLPLADALGRLGMRLAFAGARADFTGLANPPDPRDRLFISEVFHKAFVRVDEKGTEAAAATASLMEATGAPPRLDPPIELKADRPFLFFLRDEATGLVLFAGRVADPSLR